MNELIKHNKPGFTLIEITIALLILAIGLVGILSLFPVGFDAAGRASNITVATFLAQELLEDIKREGYEGDMLATAVAATALDPGDDYGYPDPEFGYSGTFADYPNYEYDIFAWDGVLDENGNREFQGSICEVKVVVYWPDEVGGPVRDNYGNPTGESRDNQRHIELITYIAKYEP